eukprot:XP_003240275.1 PREDICTED: uncharacterized protein LOC100574352 [Acyrthosiphon pisum]
MALCLQTSNINGHPHEVLVTKTIHEGNVNVSGSCSCKAGTGKCKHVVGVILKLQKTSIDSLEELSCTELCQQWGKVKSIGTEMYQTIPVKKFCHVEKYISPYSETLPDVLPNNIEEIVYETLIEGIELDPNISDKFKIHFDVPQGGHLSSNAGLHKQFINLMDQ